MSPDSTQADPIRHVARIVQDACAVLEADDANRCLVLLESLRTSGHVTDNPLTISLTAVAHGMLADERGAQAEAAEHFRIADALALPVAALLRERGRHALQHQRYDDACACYALLENLRPGALFEFAGRIPASERAKFAATVIPRMMHASPPRIYPMQPFKAAMVESFGEIGAATVWAPLIRPGQPWQLRHLPLCGLMEYAREHALTYEEIIPPRDVFMTPPAVHGKASPPGIRGRSRSVFFCVLPDIVVTGKSNLLLAKDRVLMDSQGDEYRQIDINPDADPAVLFAHDDVLGILDQTEAWRAPELEEAFSLAGIHSWNYGHWIFEFLFQVWACLERPGFARVPLIIDAQMPPQLREALTFFVGTDHPLVVLPPGHTVRVRKLWTCSKIAYWPGCERPGSHMSTLGELSNTPQLAALLRKLAPRLDSVPSAPGQNRKIYLRRKDSQKRRIVNREEVEAWFVAAGFELLDFDDLSFIEQIRRLRGADVVAGPDGAAWYGLLFARTGTRLAMLTQPFIEGYEWWNQMYCELGLPTLLYPGELHRLNTAYRSQSDHSIDTTGLADFLCALEAMPIPAGMKDATSFLSPDVVATKAVGGNASVLAADTTRVINSNDCKLVRARNQFEKGNLAEAGRLLSRHPDCANRVGRALGHIVEAARALQEGRTGIRDQHMEAAWACGVPHPIVLHEYGRYALENAQAVAETDDIDDQAALRKNQKPGLALQRALVCHDAIEQRQNGSLHVFWSHLPEVWQSRCLPLQLGKLIRSDRPPMYELQRLKSACVHRFGPLATAFVFAESLPLHSAWQLCSLPLTGLQTYAQSRALTCTELVPPCDVHMMPPPVFGRAQQDGFSGRSRSVFCCVLADITVHSKSNLLMASDCMLLDFQGDELARVPLHYDINPEVIAADGNRLVILDRAPPARKPDLAEGFSLVALNTFNYGHWIIEQMFQIWACRDLPGFNRVPLIVDAQIPVQLREVLEFFVGPEHPVVVLQPGESVRVRQLWACSRITYWPGGEKLPAPTITDFELSNVKALAAIIRRLEPLLTAVERPGYPEKIYLTRSARQGRPLVNREDVEQTFRQHGYTVLDFNETPFIEQLRHLRAARVVVLEAGSTMYGLLFCRSGTRFGELASDNPTEHEWCAEMFKALGNSLLLFPCDTVASLPDAIGSLQKSADIPALVNYLKCVES